MRVTEPAVDDLQVGDPVLGTDLDARILGGAVMGVQHGPPPAENEGIGPPQADRPAPRHHDIGIGPASAPVGQACKDGKIRRRVSRRLRLLHPGLRKLGARCAKAG